jgi:DNA-binding HxlR family transcriptional regulator
MNSNGNSKFKESITLREIHKDKTYSKVEEILEQVPSELRVLFKGLGDDLNLAIFMFLLNSNEKKSFIELKSNLGIDNATLNYHLKQLSLNALINKFFDYNEEKKTYSYYSVTSFGKRYYNSMLDSLIPLQGDDSYTSTEFKITQKRLHTIKNHGVFIKTIDWVINYAK